MKLIKHILLILFLLPASIQSIFSQKGVDKSTTVSFSNRANNNQNGFYFSGVKFGYQFVNCGGNVVMGVNYSKNANFTTYWYNGKSYNKQTIGAELWPKPNEVEINTVKADLYFKNQNLGSVKLNYIVGNFAGCFGETYDVLKQVGKNSTSKEYKDNINDLSLQNIQVIAARAIGLWREPKINDKLNLLQKQKEEEKINAKVFQIEKDANLQIALGNYKNAKLKFQEAYKLRPSDKLKAEIEKANNLLLKKDKEDKIQAKLNEAYSLLNSNNYELALTKFKEVYAVDPSESIKQQIESISKKIQEKKDETTSSNNSLSSSKKSTTTNSTTKTATSTTKKETTTEKKDTYVKKSNTIGNTGKTFEQLEYERKAYERQKQEKIKKAVDPGGYIMQKSGLNDFYRNEIAKANRASDLKKAKEEREWEAERRRQRRERIEEDRRAEEYRKQQEEQKTKYNLSLEEAYQKKGGDANFNAKLKEFHSLAISKMTYINSYLTKNGSPFQTLNYMDNCSYVQVIEIIQKNDQITYGAKIALIEELLSLKKSYVDFYMNNSKHGHDYGKSGDYHDNTINSACGQYIKTLAHSLNAPYNYHSKGSRSISNTKTDFDSEYKKRISPFQSKYDYAYNYEFRTYLKFYLEKSWTTYGTNPPKRAPTILNRKEEIEKIKLTYTLGINYHNRKDIDELTMAVFNYNHGFFDDALNHFKIYQLRTSDKEKMVGFWDKVGYWILEDETVISSLLGAILYMDYENYSEALKYLKKLKTHNLPILKKKGRGDDKILEKAIMKLENLVFFELNQYTDMWLPKDKKYFKGGTSRGKNYDLLKYYNPGILAEALYKTGNEDFAEEVIDFMINYYKKVYKFKYPYRGTQSEIDAFKRMIKIFNPKALEKMSFSVENKYSLAKNVTYNNKFMLLDWEFYQDFGNPINNTPIDLKNEDSWIKLKERKQETISKEALNTIFNEQLSIYKKGKLDISDESKAFLASLVQLGVWTGNFYEAMPAMWDLKNNYDAKDYVLFEKLLTLMTSNLEDLSFHHFYLDKNGNRKRNKNYENLSIEWFFANKNGPIIKEQLNEILKIWSFNDYTHLLIPFLYELQI